MIATELFGTNGIVARPLVLTDVRMAVLWDRMSQFPVLFATEQATSFTAFRDILEDRETVIVGFHEGDGEPMGLGMVYGIIPGVEAQIQISFFDGSLKGREPIVRAFVGWVFDELRTRRVAAHLRADARWLRTFFERVGLYFEGVLKNWVARDERLYDMYLYGITQTECDTDWRAGRPWAKPRVRLLKAYEVR